MRRTTILAAALGATFFTPIAGLAQSAPSNLILAQATEEKAKDGAPKSERAPAAKSEAPKAPPAAREAPPQAPAAKSEAPKAPQAPAATKSDPTPPQAKDRATPRAPEAAKSERTAPIERGVEKQRQDSGDAARKAKQDADAKDAAEQKSKADAARSRTEPTKAPDAKSVEPRGTERSKAVDDRRGPSQQQIQRQTPQTEERVRDRDGDRRDVGRDRDDRRDARDRDGDRRDARDRDGDRSRRGDVKRDPRDNEDIRARLRKLEQGNTSRDELSRARIEEGRRITIDGGSRTLIREGNRVIIRSNDEARFRVGRDDRRGDPRIEQLPGGRTRSVVVYPGGYEIITVRGQRGDIIYRARRDRGGREVVLIREVSRPPLTRIDLGPLQLRIPREQYIIDSRRASRNDIMIALSAPPVEPVERVYTLDEVRSFDRLRDKMRRIDVSDITFETDSAVITADQAEALEELASVINDLIDKNPGETFLIEGHTDAVGSDVYNLTLSDRRAEAIAVALSEYYDVPPENLVTQGYGEQFLKIPTEEPERENRRGAVRRVTPLVNQAAN